MSRHTHWAFSLAILFTTGCAVINGRLEAPEPPVPAGSFRVGAARVDITPPPGYPMGGFAMAGRISRGVWTRLHARAVCFEDRDGRSLALVSADLWAMPAGLADRVAELVSGRHGVPRLGREQIVLSATHTHNSPGNFSSSYFYNKFSSSKAGFDRRLFNALAERIAGAIAEAWAKRQPATLTIGRKRLSGLSRNRSLEAFRMNGADAEALIDSNRDLSLRMSPFLMGDEDAYRAIDPTLTVIHAESTNGDPVTLAALAFFAVHPTVMGPATEVYSADMFGVAAVRIEQELAVGRPARQTAPVVAIFNGPEADVSSNWHRQTRGETLKLGNMLADGIEQVLGGRGEEIAGTIGGSFGKIQLGEAIEPIGGASTLCGSEGDWTFFRDAGWYEGMVEDDPEQRIEGHGPKMHPLAPATSSRTVRGLLSFGMRHVLKPPREVRLGSYRLGSVVIGTLPGEFSTMLGLRIKEAIRQQAPWAESVLLVGLANEYVSYFATEEEYAIQHYEGSSMIYGPESGNLVRDTLAELAADLDHGELREELWRYYYKPGPRKRYGVKLFNVMRHTDRLRVTYDTLHNVLMDEDLGIPPPDLPFFNWIDSNPKWPRDPTAEVTIAASVSIEIESPQGWGPLLVNGISETDQGVDFVTTVVAALSGSSRWITFWIVPDEVEDDPLLASATFRFVVRGVDGLFRSEGFTLASARKRWGNTGIADRPLPPEL